jgi:hypothetical protein
MEIPDDGLKRTKKSERRDIRPDEASLLIGEAAAGIVGSQGALNILNHVQKMLLESDEIRRPSDGAPNPEAEITEIERFIKTDHPSHLLKVAELERFIEIAKQSTKIIDETDASGSALWDFISEDDRDEITRQLEGLKSTAALKDALETEMSSLCSETWSAHKMAKAGSERDRFERLENLLLGPEASLKDKAEMKSHKTTLLKAEELYEMLGMEKIRLVMTAETATKEDALQKSKDAYEVLGEDFYLIRNQMAHLEKCLEMDWLKCIPEEGIRTPLSGKELISPEILNRMRGEPSEEQIKALEEAYQWMAFKRSPGMDGRDKTAEKTAFCLASMQVLELGKKSKYINVFRDIQGVTKEKAAEAKLLGKDKEAVPPPLPDEYQSGKDNMKEAGGRAGGGILRVLKQYPAVLATQLWVLAKTKASKEHFGQYSCQEDAWKFLQGDMHISRIDEPM